jgi:hypothetical protein
MIGFDSIGEVADCLDLLESALGQRRSEVADFFGRKGASHLRLLVFEFVGTEFGVVFSRIKAKLRELRGFLREVRGGGIGFDEANLPAHIIFK